MLVDPDKFLFTNSNLFSFVSTDDDAQFYDVSVCTGNSHCIDCGVMASNNGDYQFTDSVCPEGTRGDTIHIVQGYQDYLKLCEVKVTGLGKSLFLSNFRYKRLLSYQIEQLFFRSC